MSDDSITAYLEEHPRMIGVLFTALILLTQVFPDLNCTTVGSLDKRKVLKLKIFVIAPT